MTQFFISYCNGVPIEIEISNTGKVELEIFGEKDLWYGEFLPPLNFEGKLVSWISFTNISRYEHSILLSGEAFKTLDMSSHAKVLLKIFPEPSMLFSRI